MTTTVRLFSIYQSELQKRGFNEFIDSKGDLVLFKNDVSFIQKIMNYDEDIQAITEWLFCGFKLDNEEFDTLFKQNFIYRFINRRINRETIEAFQIELMNVFMTNRQYLNRVYSNLEQYILNQSEQEGSNNQTSNGTSTTNSTSQGDNRQAYSELPQNEFNLDLDNSVMTSPNDNTISRDRNQSNQESLNDNNTTGENKGKSITYDLDNLIKSSTIIEDIYREFDRKCFSQIV